MAELADPAERGRLVVEPRVVERVAVLAAGEVRGVVETSSTFDKLTSRGLPRAEAHVAGRRARIQVTVAAAWPEPLQEIAAGVRDRVAERISELVSLTVDSVHVEIAQVVRSGDEERRVQ